MRRILAVMLVTALAVSLFPGDVIGQGTAGSLGGHSKYNRPDYEVRIQNVANGQIVSTVMLDSNGNFLVNNVALPGNFLVVLYDRTRMRPVCTEGPYALSGQNAATSSKLDIEISCGGPPAWLWVSGLAGGAAIAAAIALQSGSS